LPKLFGKSEKLARFRGFLAAIQNWFLRKIRLIGLDLAGHYA